MKNKNLFILKTLILITFVIFSLNPIYSQETKAENYVTRGNTYYDEGHYDAAIKEFSEAIKLNPTFSKAYYYLANAHNQKGDYDAAIANYTQAIKLDANFTNAYFNRGFTYQQKKNLDLALDDYSQAIKLNPNLEPAYVNRANVYSDKKDYSNAIADLSQAIKLENSSLAHYNRGNIYQELLDYNKAVEDFSQAIKLDPNYTSAYINRGLIYDAQKDYDLAIADFSQAIKLAPNYPNSYYNRAISYAKKNNYESAITDYTQTINLDPTFAKAYVNRGNIYFKQHNYDNAIMDFSKAIKLNSDNSNAYYSRGETHLIIGNYDNAISDFSYVIKFTPDDVDAFHNRGEAYYKKEDFDKAIIDFNKAIELAPNNFDSYFYRSLTYTKKGGDENLKLALADYKKAVELNPTGTKQLESSLSTNQQNNSWQEFSSEEGNFAVLMPNIPIKQKPLNSGGINIHTYTYSTDDVTYLVGYNVFSTALLQQLNPEETLTSVIRGMSAQSNGKVVNTLDIKLKDYLGKEFKVEGSNIVFQGRVFLIKQRVYYIMLISRTGISNTSEISNFLNSFKLLSDPTNETIVEEKSSLNNFASLAGNFSIDIPGKPQAISSVTDIANIKLAAYSFTSVVSNNVYLVVYSDLPKEAIPNNNAEELFKAIRNSTAIKSNAELLTETNITLGKHAGKFFKLKKNIGAIINTKIYLVNQRLYLISLTMADAQETHPEFEEKFLNSFQLLESDFDDPFEDNAPVVGGVAKTKEENSKAEKPTDNNINTTSSSVKKFEDLVNKGESVLRGNAIERPNPVYPSEAKQQAIEGDVIVRIIVDKDGKVARAKIVSGPMVFHDSVIKAAKAWRFNPSLLNGEPVRVVGDLTFRFKLS